jgi:hypothetical protein
MKARGRPPNPASIRRIDKIIGQAVHALAGLGYPLRGVDGVYDCVGVAAWKVRNRENANTFKGGKPLSVERVEQIYKSWKLSETADRRARGEKFEQIRRDLFNKHVLQRLDYPAYLAEIEPIRKAMQPMGWVPIHSRVSVESLRERRSMNKDYDLQELAEILVSNEGKAPKGLLPKVHGDDRMTAKVEREWAALRRLFDAGVIKIKTG